MITIQCFTFNAFGENTYVLWDETLEAIIIDPGCYDKSERLELQSFIVSNRLKPVQLINTHCHIDHVLGNAFVKETYRLPLRAHKAEMANLQSIPLYKHMYGFGAYEETFIDEFIDETTVIRFGNSELTCLFVPGHSPGHLAFYCEKQAFCINGDVLFRGSVGRTDLPGGDHGTLLKSIRTKMFALPDATVVYCGHGEATSIGFEKKHNPFLS